MRPPPSSRVLVAGLAAMASLLPFACGPAEDPPAAVNPCSPGGHLHDDHCHCDPGFHEQGLSCQPGSGGRGSNTDAGTVDDGGTMDAGVDAGVDTDGCGPHGHQHDGHCHCETGYIEEDLMCVAPPPCDDDVLEENDTDAAPTPWTSAHEQLPLMACVADDDWYTVVLQKSEQVTIDLVFAHAEGDLDMALWSPSNFEAPDQVGNSEDDNEQIVFTATESGDHYLLIFNATSDQPNNYSLQVGVQ